MWIWYLFLSTLQDEKTQNIIFIPPFSERCVSCFLPFGYVPDPHSLLDVGWGDLIAQIHHELCKLLDVNDVLWVLRVGIDDLGAPGTVKNITFL